jgi:hypothetical protein
MDTSSIEAKWQFSRASLSNIGMMDDLTARSETQIPSRKAKTELVPGVFELEYKLAERAVNWFRTRGPENGINRVKFVFNKISFDNLELSFRDTNRGPRQLLGFAKGNRDEDGGTAVT